MALNCKHICDHFPTIMLTVGSFVKGVAYQQTLANISVGSQQYIDPLADSSGCARDIPYIQKLGMNAVRVYAIDPTLNHDDCMNAFADAGVYVFAALSAPADGCTSLHIITSQDD